MSSNPSSKDEKKASKYDKLPSVSKHSTQGNKTSIMVDDASKYLEQLKGKKIGLDQESSSHDQDSQPIEINVETLENGFLINVFYESNFPGLLVSVLETFEELGLEVLHANVSCSPNFHFKAIGGKNEEMGDGIDAQVVKETVLKAIKRRSENNDHHHEQHDR